MSVGTSTIPADRAAALRELVQEHYPDAHRISVSLSATGEGRHLRWHYSENFIGGPEEHEEGGAQPQPPREPSPALSYASNHLVDDDGDSVMGDDDDERPQTPPRLGEYDPGSVVLTPKKDGWRALRREQRIGGGFNWWHEQDGVDARMAFVRDSSAPPQGAVVVPGPAGRAQLGPDALRLLEELEEERGRHGRPRDRSYSPSYKSASPYYDDENDDARSEISVASDATVIVDPRKRGKPTLFKGEKPIVRQPTVPADYEWDGPRAVRANTVDPQAQEDRGKGRAVRERLHGLSTIREEGSVASTSSSRTQVWPPRVPEPTHVRVYRDQDGRWVREGSLGPDAVYQIERELMPPRIDVDIPQAGPSTSRPGPSSSRRSSPVKKVTIQRTDTEIVEEAPTLIRRMQRAEPVVNLRRSARLRR